VLGALLLPQALALLVQGAAPLLLRRAPLVLLALHPFEPWSLLVSTRTDLLPFVVTVVGVRTVPCCAGYLVGRWYGPPALSRLARRGGDAAAARIRGLSGRFGSALLLLYPGATASVLAGADALPVRRFLPLMTTGLVLAALLTRLVATAAEGPLTAAAAALDRWAVLAGLVLLALVVLAQLRPGRRRHG
jgi:membrane protein DedA with SNARE-associated domain